MSNVLAPPKNVSPLIRAGRWTFLLLGIWYGGAHLRSLQAKDAPLRKAAIEKATRDHHKAEHDKKIQDKENMANLAIAAGIKIKST